MKRSHGACWATLALLAAGASAQAQSFGGSERIGTMGNTVAIAFAPGERTRMYVLQLSGEVRIVQNGATLATPFLTVTECCGNGATGLVFDPDFQNNRFVYIAYTASNGNRLERYRVSDTDPNLADPATATRIITTPLGGQHTGGWIDFGRDGYLYFSGGDGAAQFQQVQNRDSLYGKMLRLDIRTDGFPDDPDRFYTIPATNPWAGPIAGADEVWATGLRNAFRCSFDRDTGDLWIADVGQSAREEINRQPANSSGGENYGWPCYEGFVRTALSGPCNNPSIFTPPAFDLSHHQLACIIGGYVYRGCANPKMRGRYVFGSCTFGFPLASINAASPAGSLIDHGRQGGISNVYGFGEDPDGEIYACTSTGVYKLLPPAEAWTADCNHNGRPDDCEIADGSAIDANGDGILDSCTRFCPADFDASGALGVGDIYSFVNRWFGGHADTDFNGADGVTLQDLFDFLGAYFAGC